jgi:hypothetical protein
MAITDQADVWGEFRRVAIQYRALDAAAAIGIIGREEVGCMLHRLA